MSDPVRYVRHPAAVECAARVIRPLVAVLGVTSAELERVPPAMAQSVIVALVTEGHMVPASERDHAVYHARAMERDRDVALLRLGEQRGLTSDQLQDQAPLAGHSQNDSTALAEAVALLRRIKGRDTHGLAKDLAEELDAFLATRPEAPDA